MADTKQAPAAAPAAAETKTETKSARPTMPDEAEYQKKLKVAEKEHKEALDQLVSFISSSLATCSSNPFHNWEKRK